MGWAACWAPCEGLPSSLPLRLFRGMPLITEAAFVDGDDALPAFALKLARRFRLALRSPTDLACLATVQTAFQRIGWRSALPVLAHAITSPRGWGHSSDHRYTGRSPRPSDQRRRGRSCMAPLVHRTHTRGRTRCARLSLRMGYPLSWPWLITTSRRRAQASRASRRAMRSAQRRQHARFVRRGRGSSRRR